MRGYEGLLKIGLYLQLLWYISFVTNILGVIGSQSELLQDVFWLGVPICGLIISIVYTIKRKFTAPVLLLINYIVVIDHFFMVFDLFHHFDVIDETKKTIQPPIRVLNGLF